MSLLPCSLFDYPPCFLFLGLGKFIDVVSFEDVVDARLEECFFV